MNAIDLRADNVVSFEQAQKSVRRRQPGNREQLPDSEEIKILRRQIKAARDYIGCLGALAQAIDDHSSEVEIMGTLERALSQVIAATSASAGALLVLDEENGDLVYTLAAGERNIRQLIWKRIAPGRGICQWVAKHKNLAIINDAASDTRVHHDNEDDGDFRLRSIVVAPLLLNGKIHGVIELLNKKDGGYFTINDQSHVTLLTHLSAIVLDKVGMPTVD